MPSYFCDMKIRWAAWAAATWAILAACNNEGSNEPTAAATPVATNDRLKKQIDRYPDSLLLRDSLINWYASQEQYEAALAATEAVLQKDSTLAYFWDMKAKFHGMNDDTVQAIRALEKACALNPLPEYLMSLGYLYADTKNPAALAIGDSILTLYKAVAGKEGLLVKGIYLYKTGKANQAINLFDQILREDYTFLFAYREKAIALYELGRYGEAMEVLKKATTLRNNFDEGYYWMGRCSEKMGNLAEAADHYQMALLYDPDFLEAQDALERLGIKR
jgi:tetratricopeptide (TPR) repeat protein